MNTTPAALGLLAMAVMGCPSATGPMAVCGDGVVAAPEVCDDGPGNGTPGHCRADCTGLPARVSITGDVFAFMSEVDGARVAGARITVLEQPERSVTTDAEAHFEIDDLEEGTEVTLVVEHAGFFPTQTATVTLGPHGVHPFVVQALPTGLFNALSGLFPSLEMDRYCILSTTVARLGGTVHVMARQGEAGSRTTIQPALPAESGPIYFDENVIPSAQLTETTKDGGVVYIKVPPGEYTISATKAGRVFAPAKMKCRAGYLVNGGPPLGVQADVVSPDWGGAQPDDAFTAASDALCARTAACVNARRPGNYPPATEASCRAMFRRAWSFVDADCAGASGVKDAWRTYFACKSGSCELTLGSDTACPTEEAALVAAQAAYGECYGLKHGAERRVSLK